MAETTGLLNRRTGHSVPRVRISSSPQNTKLNATASSFFVFRTSLMVLKREFVSDTNRHFVGFFPVKAFEERAILIRIDFLFADPVVHQSKLNAMCSGDVPVESHGSTQTVDICVIVAEKLIIGVSPGGLVPGRRALRCVENVAHFDIGKWLYHSEPLPLDRETGFELKLIRHVLESVHGVCGVGELKFLAKRKFPVSDAVLSCEIERETVAWLECIH